VNDACRPSRVPPTSRTRPGSPSDTDQLLPRYRRRQAIPRWSLSAVVRDDDVRIVLDPIPGVRRLGQRHGFDPLHRLSDSGTRSRQPYTWSSSFGTSAVAVNRIAPSASGCQMPNWICACAELPRTSSVPHPASSAPIARVATVQQLLHCSCIHWSPLLHRSSSDRPLVFRIRSRSRSVGFRNPRRSELSRRSASFTSRAIGRCHPPDEAS